MDKFRLEEKPPFLISPWTFLPLLQIWQIELMKFNHRKKASTLLGFHQIKPRLGISQKTADRIAISLRPFCFGLSLILEILLLIFRAPKNWIWWTAVVVQSILLFIFSIKFTYQLIYEVRLKIHTEEVIANAPAIQVRDGGAGAGKTSSLFNDSKIIADDSWANICFKYFMLEPYLDDIPFWPQKDKEDAEEIIESYQYYMDSNSYPCLWTSIPGFVDSVPTNKVTADFLLQKKRFPYGSTIMLDEASLILPQELYKEKPYEIVEMCKFPRHFGDFKFSSTEQDENSNLIYFRRSSGLSIHILSQEHVLRCRFLEFIMNLQLKLTRHITKFKSSYFKALEQIINSIGYRKYTYISALKNVVVENKVKSFILRPNLNIKYDSRSYKNVYRCKDAPLEKSSWTGLRLSNEEIKEVFKDDLRGDNYSKKTRKSYKS